MATPSIEAKIVVLGGQGVGKTSLVHRFCHTHFVPSPSIPSTIGASFLTKRVVDIDSGTTVRLQIWDTAGQERFRSISKLYYRGANAALLCYDITNPQSFQEMAHWLTELQASLPSDTVLHIVGTKSDLVAVDPGCRAVSFESVVAFAAQHLYPPSSAVTPLLLPTPGSARSGGLLGPAKSPAEPLASPASNRSSMGFWGLDVGWDSCHEVSASTGEGVEEVFRVITRRLVEQRSARAGLEARLAEESGMSDVASGGEHGGSDMGGPVYGPATGGSFRIGMHDKRRSWYGLPQFPAAPAEAETEVEGRSKSGRCC
ncbi:putative ras-like GTP-binding protein [Microthyrium microscopicum]|uniref:Putative ras-like GTP-binding protein n=1 Tax=Microthyrium microscopicum TaxID=703497 RepID=A0A6A6U1K2_9PEZI|nr:putative ras-like GTP-binding protein [Microthyrium microscopicum]